MTKEDILCNQILSAAQPKTVIDCATAIDKMGNTQEEREVKKKRKIKLIPLPLTPEEAKEQQDIMARARMVYISKLTTNEVPTPLTYEEFKRLANDNKTFAIQCQINNLLDQHNGDKYACKEEYDALKRKQYSILPHCNAYDGDGHRSKDNLIHASGLAMLDIDGIDNPRALFDQLTKAQLITLGVVLAYITPSKQGLRLIFKRLHGETIHEAQVRMAAELGIQPDAKEFDTAVCDPQRASVLVPKSLILYVNKELFYFNDEQEKLDTWAEFDQIDRNGKTECESTNNVKTNIAQPSSCIAHNIATPSSCETNIATPSSCEAHRPTSYNYQGVEIPYSSIIDQLILGELKTTTTPSVGQRHPTYLTVVKNLKLITDYDIDWMFDIIPSFDLPAEERRDILKNHKKKTLSNFPAKLTAALALAKRDTENNAAHSQDDNGTLDPNSIPFPKVMPPLFEAILSNVPEPYWRQMIVWCLPFLGACGTGLRFKYREQINSLSFMTILFAKTSGGKSSLVNKITKLLLKQIVEEDEQRVNIQREYEQKLEKYNRSRKANAERPEDPHCDFRRKQTVRMSLTHIYRNLQNSMYRDGYDHKQDPLHLIAWTDEINDLIQTEKAGTWSEKKTLYCHSFHNEEDGNGTITSGYMSAPIFYNWAALGTPDKLRQFLDPSDNEGGLVNRIIFAALPEDPDDDGIEILDYSQKNTEAILDACFRLSEAHGTYYAPIVDQKIKEWVDEKKKIYKQTKNEAIRILKNRSAAMGAKAAYLLAYLNGSASHSQRKTFSKKVTEDMNNAADWGVFLAEFIFQWQLLLWADDLNKATQNAYYYNAGATAKGYAALNFLASLPHTFSRDEYNAQAALAGKSEGNARKMICDWLSKGRIVKNDDDTYTKVS